MLANIVAGYSLALAVVSVIPFHFNGLALLEMWQFWEQFTI